MPESMDGTEPYTFKAFSTHAYLWQSLFTFLFYFWRHGLSLCCPQAHDLSASNSWMLELHLAYEIILLIHSERVQQTSNAPELSKQCTVSYMTTIPRIFHLILLDYKRPRAGGVKLDKEMKPHYNQGHLNIKNHFLARDPSQDPTQVSTVFTTQGNITVLRLGCRSGWGHWSATKEIWCST